MHADSWDMFIVNEIHLASNLWAFVDDIAVG